MARVSNCSREAQTPPIWGECWEIKRRHSWHAYCMDERQWIKKVVNWDNICPVAKKFCPQQRNWTITLRSSLWEIRNCRFNLGDQNSERNLSHPRKRGRLQNDSIHTQPVAETNSETIADVQEIVYSSTESSAEPSTSVTIEMPKVCSYWF